MAAVRPVHHAVQLADCQDQTQVAPVEGEWRTADLKGHRLLESTVERTVGDLLVQLLIGEGVLPERVGTPRVGDLPHVEISLAGIAWRSFYPGHWLDLAKRRDLLNLEGIPPTHVHFVESAGGRERVFGKDFLPPLADDRDLLVGPDQLAVFILAVREPVDADVLIVRVEEVDKHPGASQGGEWADQDQDAFDDQQRRCLLAERHLLTSSAAQLVIEGWIAINQPEAVPGALDPEEGRGADVMTLGHESLDVVAAVLVQLNSVGLAFGDTEKTSELLDRFASTRTRVQHATLYRTSCLGPVAGPGDASQARLLPVGEQG